MGQDISIVKIKEDGESVAQLDVNFNDIFVELYHQKKYGLLKKEFPWLSTIDSFGLTYFNSFQIPYVIQELKRIKELLNDKEINNKIGKIIHFFKNVEEHSELIMLIGD